MSHKDNAANLEAKVMHLLKALLHLKSAEKISALTPEGYLKERASQGSRSSYEAVLAKVADVAPEPNDLLPLAE